MTKESLRRWWHITSWRVRYFLLDTDAGRRCILGVAGLAWVWTLVEFVSLMRVAASDVQQQAFWVQVVWFVVSVLVSMALTPKQPDAADQVVEAPRLKDGSGVRMVFGEVWITDPDIIGWKKMGTKTIRGKKSGFNGRPIIGYWYKQLFHFLLCRGPVDAVLEFRGGDKTAWKGEMTATGEVQINQRELWGGQGTGGEGGIEGPMQFLFGDDAQMPSSYLASSLDPKQPAYRGLVTALYKGGLWGAFSPYPKAASFKVRRILEGWERDAGAWYPEKATIAFVPTIHEGRWTHLRMVVDGSLVYGFINGRLVISGSLDFFPDGGVGGYTTVGRYRHTAPGSNYGGYIDNVTITRSVRSTGDFTPSRVAYSADNDPLWGDVVISLRGEGEDGSTNFVDDKGNGWTPLSAGIAISRDYAVDGGSSIKVESASAGAISTPYTPGLNVGAHFTVDAWVRPDALAGYVICINQLDADHAGYWMRLQPDGRLEIVIGRNDWPSTPVSFTSGAFDTTLRGMNAAHAIYQSITDSWMGAEPEASINDASFRAAADTLYAEGFGLCTEWDSTTESVEQFQQRICNVIGANLSRSPVDGLWYLDLIRGGYDTSTLPVLTDDDIIEYSEQPGTLQDAVNQVIVEWRDPQRREDRSTSPVQSLGGIQAVGAVVGEVATHREIPEEALALRVGGSILQSKARPLRRIATKTTRIAHAWRPGQVIELQSAKRGIASMYCRIGDADRGTLRSGAIALTLLQDTFGLPESVYVTPDPTTDPGDEDVPKPVSASAVQEMPYALHATLQPPGELAAMPADAGFLFAVATPAGSEVDYSLHVDAGAGFDEQAESDWSATALTAAAAGRLEAVIGITAARGLEDAAIGAMVLWADEICRLDAVDLIAGTVTLGRGCADTVPAEHAPGSRLWVIDDSIAVDATRYSDGTTVAAKLLPRTSSQRLELSAATAASVAFASRAARPYPPASVTLNGDTSPLEVVETADVAWLHRDRIASAELLVDQSAASIGPEAGTTYTVRWYLGGVLDHTVTGITGTTASYAPAADGLLRVEVEALRDGLTSRQMQVIECNYRVTPYSDYVDEVGDVYADQGGDTYLG